MFKDLGKEPVKGFNVSQNLLASQGQGSGTENAHTFVLKLYL
jgi:hypothetical protein